MYIFLNSLLPLSPQHLQKIGIVYSFFTGNVDVLNNSLISSGEDAISMILKMIPLLCLWLGVMKIAEASNLIDKISGFLSKAIHPLFPELKKILLQ